MNQNGLPLLEQSEHNSKNPAAHVCSISHWYSSKTNSSLPYFYTWFDLKLGLCWETIRLILSHNNSEQRQRSESGRKQWQLPRLSVWATVEKSFPEYINVTHKQLLCVNDGWKFASPVMSTRTFSWGDGGLVSWLFHLLISLEVELKLRPGQLRDLLRQPRQNRPSTAAEGTQTRTPGFMSRSSPWQSYTKLKQSKYITPNPLKSLEWHLDTNKMFRNVLKKGEMYYLCPYDFEKESQADDSCSTSSRCNSEFTTSPLN